MRNPKSRKLENALFLFVVYAFLFLSIGILSFFFLFLAKESLPLFESVSPPSFLFSSKWNPMAFTGTASFGIFHFLMGSISVSFLALLFSTILSLGCSIFFAFYFWEKGRRILYPLLDLLSGIPSVVYGFIGLTVGKPLFLKMGVSTGSCVLLASILLSILIFPFMVDSITDSMVKLKEQYFLEARALGLSPAYIILRLILPSSLRSIFLAFLLGSGRALGETMAVMMVVGNANLFPKLLSKGETIASLIALEMGSAEYHSLHYHALYASGLVLLLLVALIHLLVKMGERPRTSYSTSQASHPNRGTSESPSVHSPGNREEATPRLLATGKRAQASRSFSAVLLFLYSLLSFLLIFSALLFFFLYIFYKGYKVISPSFLLEAPKGMVLGEEGGIFPAITGSLAFSLTALVLSGLPSLFTAIFMVFYTKEGRVKDSLHFFIHLLSGVPSIVLGLFSYSLFVYQLKLGRSVLSGAIALAIMIFPFMEIRMEKIFEEVPKSYLQSSESLGCSKGYTIRRLVLPYTLPELLSTMLLAFCFALGATPPILFTGGVAFAKSPTSLLSPAMALPLHLYLLLVQGGSSLSRAYGTALVMLFLLLIGNGIASLLTAYCHRKWQR
ncbi:phosphate ABC transporter permease subunit PstC [Oribacterium sinus]|uniref:phosphate ABC transporter permease subunit PstC n=1 Tax=Oribacterium sinus TaxID=237576 RepID=UPI0028EDAD20|nr:phosphate ABC transporter permease subunit PstC [Oribacterium sinus]